MNDLNKAERDLIEEATNATARGRWILSPEFVDRVLGVKTDVLKAEIDGLTADLAEFRAALPLKTELYTIETDELLRRIAARGVNLAEINELMAKLIRMVRTAKR